MPSLIFLPSILLDEGHNKGTFDLYLEHNQIGPHARGKYLSEKICYEGSAKLMNCTFILQINITILPSQLGHSEENSFLPLTDLETEIVVKNDKDPIICS